MEISERLQAVMRYKNLSGKDLAEKLHVQRSAISHIMSGRNKPSIDFLERFITAFPDINIQWFISGKGAMFTENSSASTHKTQKQEHSLFSFTDVNSEKSKPLQVNSD
ncbi:MAG TPA: helix-turn-helix transcriptional regulator, partial [Salinivirgaceae bacterium]|nr:helix-turn-helix transcriptional regulator [Salinivirgaceae bacterium]